MSRRAREGAALLAVLILVAILSIVAVVVLDDVRFSIRRAQNVEAQTQAQWYALGAERLARRRIRQLTQASPDRTPAPAEWNGRRFDFPIDGGALALTVYDGQACFNLNSLVEGGSTARLPSLPGQAQFVAFQQGMGVPAAEAQRLASRLAQVITDDGLLVEPSELRGLGVSAAAYARLRPRVCALPMTGPTRFNVNSLTPADAPLLAMLAPDQLSVEAARRVLASRPDGGWADVDAFWATPALASAVAELEEDSEGTPSGIDRALGRQAVSVRDQVTVATRYFAFEAEVVWAGSEAVRSGLIEVGRDGRVRTVATRWTLPE